MKKGLMIVISIIISILLVVGFFAMILFRSNAKYINYKEMNHYYESSKFYISSSILDTDNKNNIINNYNFKPIEFTIKNSLNTNQITNYDISYNLECKVSEDASRYYRCIIDNTNNTINKELKKDFLCKEDITLTEEECLKEKYTLELKKVENNHSIKLEKLTEEEYPNTYISLELVLNTTKPFTHKLTGTYILNLNNNNQDIVDIKLTKDINSLCEYQITNKYLSEKEIKLNINTNNVLIDESSNIYINRLSNTTNINNYIDSINILMNSFETTTLNLYKKDFSIPCNIDDITYSIIE